MCRSAASFSAWLRFSLILAFAGAVVAATHQVAEAVRGHERRYWIGFAVLSGVLALLVAAMFAVLVYFTGTLA